MLEQHYEGVLGVIDHWQSLEAGLLALIAGVLAFLTGRQQVESVRSQTAYLTSENRRALARRGLAATNMLDGMIGAIKESLVAIRNHASSLNDPMGQATVPEIFKQQVRDVDVPLIWDDLGRCNSEIIRYFMDLETRIQQLKHNLNRDAARIRAQIVDIDNILKFLTEEIASERGKALQVLKGADGPASGP